jgi:hypothetical protein
MLRQRVIICLLGNDPFSEKGVQWLDASWRSGQGAQQLIRGDSMLRKELKFRRKRATRRPDRTVDARWRPCSRPIREWLGC